MSLTSLVRQRANGRRGAGKRERVKATQLAIKRAGVNTELNSYKAYQEDCVKIDVEALPAAVEFSPTTPSELLVADDRGNLAIIDPYQEVPDKRIRLRWRAHRNAILAATWTMDGEVVLCSSADRSISSWHRGKLVNSFQSGGAVRCLAPSPATPFIFAAGGRDCDISLFDSRQLVRRPVITMTKAIIPYRHVEGVHYPGTMTSTVRRRSTLPNHRHSLMPMQDKTVSSIKFVNEHEFVSCGVNDHTVKLWDMRKLRDHKDAKLVLRSPSQRGFTSLASLNNSLFVSCMDGHIYEYGLNASITSPRLSIRGHSCEGSGCVYLKLAISTQLRKMMIGSTDGYARVYPIDNSSLQFQRNETERPLEGVMKIGAGGGNPTLYCSWATNNAIALASDDAVVAVYMAESDFDQYERLELPSERLHAKVEQCNQGHFLSFKHTKPIEPSYTADETIHEMNEKYASIKGVSDPSKLCPWRNFRQAKKRCFEPDETTYRRPPKRIVLQTKLQNNIRVSSPRRGRPTSAAMLEPSQSSIKKFFSPKPK